MPHFTTKQGALFYCYAIDVEQTAKIDKFLKILEDSGVSEIIDRVFVEKDFGRPGLNPYLLFAAIVYGFAFGSPTLRELETSCAYDVRFMYITNGVQPDHSSFSRFINKVIKPYTDEIFSKVTKAYLKFCRITNEECHIDGTKFEARPNKYKVVWKPTIFHTKLCGKVRTLLKNLSLDANVSDNDIFPSILIANKLHEAEDLPRPENIKECKILDTKIENLEGYLFKALEYEEKEAICGVNRNSYYKTDHDATAMCLKEDYYSGLGSNLHAAYQMQTVVSHGFVVSYYVSQDRTDIYTFIPTLNRFHEMYGCYPKRITADAGYGCKDNYKFCRDNNIEAFIKYQNWTGEASGRRPATYELQPDGLIKCVNGIIGQRVELKDRHHKIKNGSFFRVMCPKNCPFMTYCRRYMKELIGSEKIFEVDTEYQKLKQEARDRLLSPKGIEMRINRSCQIEGVYGIEKYNMSYGRIRRVGISRVRTEYMLTILGLNTRKLFRVFDGRTNLNYWKAPEGLQPEKFKKPSAKRLTARVLKKKTAQPNEIAKNSYKNKYKSTKK